MRSCAAIARFIAASTVCRASQTNQLLNSLHAQPPRTDGERGRSQRLVPRLLGTAEQDANHFALTTRLWQLTFFLSEQLLEPRAPFTTPRRLDCT